MKIEVRTNINTYQLSFGCRKKIGTERNGENNSIDPHVAKLEGHHAASESDKTQKLRAKKSNVLVLTS